MLYVAVIFSWHARTENRACTEINIEVFVIILRKYIYPNIFFTHRKRATN